MQLEKMYTTDKQIFRLIEYLKFNNRISSTSEFCLSVNMPKQNISKIKKGGSHFTVQNISAICKKYNVNANWVYGFEKKVFNSKSSIELVI